MKTLCTGNIVVPCSPYLFSLLTMISEETTPSRVICTSGSTLFGGTAASDLVTMEKGDDSY